MIIDADVHISPKKEGEHSIGIEELIHRMEKAKVDKALTWLQPPYMRELDAANEYIYKASEKYPDKIIGFGWADPNLGVGKAKDMVKKCIYEYGFCGVKLNGAQNSYYIDDPVLSMPVIEQIAKTGKILAFHVGGDAFEYTHPFRVAKIAKLYPQLRILLVHMGGAAFFGLSDAVIEFAEQNPNLFLVGSAVRTNYILKAIRRLGASRVCFGSDTPFEVMHVEIARYKAMLEGEFTKEDIANIMGLNILRLINRN